MDYTKVIFYNGGNYDKVLKSGSGTTNIGGNGNWNNIVTFSELGLTRPPKVHIIFRSPSNTTWKLPGGGTYFNGENAPLVRVTNTAIQVLRYQPSASYNFKYWILDTSMKAN